jgi:hypothetical protein
VRLEPWGKIVSRHEVCEMEAQLFMIVVVIPLNVQRENDPPDHFLIRFTLLDCSVHSLDLTVSPWMVGFGQPMLNPVRVADHVKTLGPRMCTVSVSGLLGELDAIVGQDGVDVIGDGFE